MNQAVKSFPATLETQEPQVTSLSERRKQPIRQAIRYSLSAYLCELNGHDPGDLYEFVLSEVERPLFEIVVKHADGNLSKAAQILGLNRGTLRKKLKKYGLDN